MKLCFSTLGCVENSLQQIIELAVSYGMDGVEFRGVGGQMDNTKIEAFSPQLADSTRAALGASGIRSVVLGTSCAFHNEKKRASAAKEGRQCIDIAQRMGIPYIRVFGNNIEGDREECIPSVAMGIGDLCAYGAERGVGVLLEVHGDFNTAESLEPIIRANSQYSGFGLIWDIAHSHRACGKRWQSFYEAVRPYVRHMHVKDVRDADGKLVLPGDGDIPITDIVGCVVADGYDGYFSLEWEKKWHPELADLSVALERFVEIMN